ncbi:hypothetical protein [Rhodoferax sp. U11-2br]|uniref:hypothetical protein n=1 Tax=Rhodoferax sp. U11-2br TaxID=2838878 RepID=UPI001BEB33F4|nr:hypothetical protein [Rhodoferax sp. U11-2br]MBT3067618.1 hypothetical protein [Rhodoferax sp. U11-2br]
MTQQSPNYDAAALPGATVAAVLSTFMPKGPYGYISAIISITLLAILFAFEIRRQRTSAQTVAFACVVGLSAMLLYGFVAEFIISKGTLTGTQGAEPDTQVPMNYLMLSWPITVAMVCVWDRLVIQAQLVRAEPDA